MQIDQVQYERWISDNNDGNRMIRASATLVEGDNPAEALDTLRELVVGKLAADVEAERAEEEAARGAGDNGGDGAAAKIATHPGRLGWSDTELAAIFAQVDLIREDLATKETYPYGNRRW